MAKIYCLKCNAATSYDSTRPKFCSNCGKAYIDAPVSNTSVVREVPKVTFVASNRQNRPTESEYTNEDDETLDVQVMPNIDKIEFRLTNTNLRPLTQNGRDLFNEGNQSDADEVLSKKRTPKSSKAQQKQIKESFRQDFLNQLKSKKGNSSEIQ